jgi:hypothetical protein
MTPMAGGVSLFSLMAATLGGDKAVSKCQFGRFLKERRRLRKLDF